MADLLYAVIYLTGLGVWVLIAFVFGCVLFEIGLAAANAASWCRWRARIETLNGRPVMVKDAAEAFLARWVEFIGHRNNGRLEFQCPGGYWKGIGDWKARREPRFLGPAAGEADE